MGSIFDKLRGRRDNPEDERPELEALTEDAPWAAPHPADRQPGESADEWGLFTAYCAEDTSIAKFAAKVHDRTPAAIRRLAWERAWERRRAALRASLGAEYLAAAVASARAQGAEAGRIVTLMEAILVDSLVHHAARGSKLTLRSIPAFARATLEARNLLEGKPTAHVTHSALTPENLSEIDKILNPPEAPEEHENETPTEH